METAKSYPVFNLKKAYSFHSGVATKQLRSFALIFFVFFGLVLGVGPVVLHKGEARHWALIVGSVFLLFGLIAPKALKSLYQAWMVFGGILGYINTRIILAVVFFAVLTPVAFVRRLLGKDALGLQFQPEVKTYKRSMNGSSKLDMSRQF